ncbi:MAG TPA: ABC transporter ATP-binding protein [Oligoflexus sp.]|uniref:ABC transporter ATP-binding protein n=1 Tax=Oligoflexus sp. TaxID=1971216 RepID=UPI002D23A7D1|nr:ABC transporter ATP-binding protein [Oligoflexus sp.]HYX34999.1 ABC transporter ATP-binding protein [Oligoflexus sp.]
MIRTHQLNKTFGSFTAVRNIDLSAEKGSVYGFLGANGAGKTTTIKMLMGLLVPTSGQASVGGLDCQKDRIEVKRLIGYLPDVPLFPEFLKGREVVQMAGELQGMSRKAARIRADELINQMGLEEASEEYSTNYSTGMKKRLGLAAAMVHDPDVLLLDEPTNGLDPYASKQMREWITESAGRGKTILLSTHLLDMAERVCSHLGIIHRGDMVCQGTMQEIRDQRVQQGNLEDIFFAVTAAGVAHESPA